MLDCESASELLLGVAARESVPLNDNALFSLPNINEVFDRVEVLALRELSAVVEPLVSSKW